MKEENWSIQTTGSSRLAANVSCLGWPDPPTTTNQFLSVIPLWRSWPGLMPSTWKIPAVVAGGLFTIWPEKAFRLAATECVTSCAAWVYGRSTRNQGRPFQAALLSGFPVWWTSTGSHPLIRFGRRISPISRCTKGSCIWWRSLTSSLGTFSAGSFPTAWIRNSAWTRWRWPWPVAAGQGSFIQARVVNSPLPTSWAGCRQKTSRSAGLAEGGATTTSCSKDSGVRLSTWPQASRRSRVEVYLRAYSDGWDAEISLARFLWMYCHVRPHSSLGGKTPHEVYSCIETHSSRPGLTVSGAKTVQ